MRELEMGADRRRRRGIRDGLLDRPQHQRERRAELVADVREEHGLRAVDLGQCLGALPLGFQRSLILFSLDPFGNVHSRRDRDDHAPAGIPDRHAGEVDDMLRTITPEIPRLAAEHLAGDGLFDRVSNPRLHLRGAVPPAALPEWPVEDVGAIETADFDGGSIDIGDCSVEPQARGEQALVIHRLELLGHFTQLAVGFLQLSTARNDFEPQRLAFARQGSISCETARSRLRRDGR